MNTVDNERKLKEMMKNVRLESPGPDFSSKVMEAILAGTEKKNTLRTEPILGKKFWIFVSLFILLAVVMSAFFGNEPSPWSKPFQQFISGFPKVDPEPVKNFMEQLSGKAGSLPWTLAAVIAGSSLLMIADKLFTDRHKISDHLKPEAR